MRSTICEQENRFKLEPDHLLMLDDYLYIIGACRFSQNVYKLEDKTEQDKNQSDQS